MSSRRDSRSLGLCEDASNFAQLAIEHDNAGNTASAIFYYSEAAEALLQAAFLDPTIAVNAHKKAYEYLERMEILRRGQGRNNFQIGHAFLYSCLLT